MQEQRVIESIVRRVVEQHAFSGAGGPALWRRLERDVSQRLVELQRRGVITRFVVRCNEETNEGSGGEPVVDVVFSTPRRVKEVVLRFNAMG